MTEMERVTIRVTERQLERLDELIEHGMFPNRSEAIRTGMNDLIDDRRQQMRQERNNKIFGRLGNE